MPITRMTTRDAWTVDLDQVSANLEHLGAIYEPEPGFLAVDESKAPAELVDLYRELCQIGYVNGWLS